MRLTVEPCVVGKMRVLTATGMAALGKAVWAGLSAKTKRASSTGY